MSGPGLAGPVSPPPFHPIPVLDGKWHLRSNDARCDVAKALSGQATRVPSQIDPSGLFFIDSTTNPAIVHSASPFASAGWNVAGTGNSSAFMSADQLHPSRRMMITSGNAVPDDDIQGLPDDGPACIVDGQRFANGANSVALYSKPADEGSQEQNNPKQAQNQIKPQPKNQTKAQPKKQPKSQPKKQPKPQPKKLTKGEKKKLRNEAQALTMDKACLYAKIIEGKQTEIEKKEEEIRRAHDENKLLRLILGGLDFSDMDIDELLLRVEDGQLVKAAIAETRSK